MKKDKPETCKNCKWIKRSETTWSISNRMNSLSIKFGCMYDREIIQKEPDDFCHLFEEKEYK